MNDKNISIKEIFKITFNLEDIPSDIRGHMHEWYYEMIQKTYNQLTIFDITRMIIQKELLDVAIDKALEYIAEDPLSGQRYDGELLELLSKLDVELYGDRMPYMKEILEKIHSKVSTLDWISEEDCQEYTDTLDKLLRKINK